MENRIVNFFENNKKPLTFKSQSLDGVTYKSIQKVLGNVSAAELKKNKFKISYVILDNTDEAIYVITR